MDSSGRFIALGMGDGTMRVLDARTGLPLAPQLPTASLRLNNLSISPDGRYIATSGFPPSVNIWDSRTFTPVGLPLPIEVTQGGRARDSAPTVGSGCSPARSYRSSPSTRTNGWPGPARRQHAPSPRASTRRSCLTVPISLPAPDRLHSGP
jgi:WD40 repeat protein